MIPLYRVHQVVGLWVLQGIVERLFVDTTEEQHIVGTARHGRGTNKGKQPRGVIVFELVVIRCSCATFGLA